MAAVHSLDAFVFTVPDLAEAERFYSAFGLQTRLADGRLELYTDGNPHCWGVLHESKGVPKKLQYLSFGCFEQDFDAIAARARAEGFATAEPHPLAELQGQGQGQSLW